MSRRRIVAALGVACIALGGALVVFAPALNRALARDDAQPGLVATAPAAVVALSSGLELDGGLDAYGAERLAFAIRLATQYSSARLLTTRVHNAHGTASDSAQRALIGAAPVVPRWTIMAGDVHSTRDEALLTTRYLPPDAGGIIVVTSVSHTTRACATFERVGYRVVCRAAPPGSHAWWRPAYDFTYERAAVLDYRMRGWLP